MSIECLIAAGYLGAGKTTAINEFLRDPQGRRAIVLVNDFGAVNIDAALIENTEGDTIALTNGCACCAIGDDLLGAARRAVEAAPDLVIVEASGVSEPARMAMLLRGAGGLAPARILTLVNGAAAARNAGDKFIGRLFRSQIEAADFVAVNRADGAEAVVGNLLSRHAGGARRVHGLCSALERLPDSPPRRDALADAELPGFHSTAVDVPAPVTPAQLLAWAAALPPAVARAKGIVETPQGLMRFDITQGEAALQPADESLRGVSGRLVVIAPEAVAVLPVADFAS